MSQDGTVCFFSSDTWSLAGHFFCKTSQSVAQYDEMAQMIFAAAIIISEWAYFICYALLNWLASELEGAVLADTA